MSTEAIKSIHATFEAREQADRAIEHLVQEYGIDRSHIFVEADGRDNTSGTTASGGDTSGKAGEKSRSDAVLAGNIQVSVDVGPDEVVKAQEAFRQTGAKTVFSR